MHEKRATRIVATLGPASTDEKMLRRLILAGADIFRFNMSHGSQEEHEEAFLRLRKVAGRLDRPVGALFDLQGPKLRTGRNEGGELIPLRHGEKVLLACPSGSAKGSGGQGKDAAGKWKRAQQARVSRPGSIWIESPGLCGFLEPGDDLLLDDGRMRLKVLGPERGGLKATVITGGKLKERAGVNIPGRAIPIPVPTPKDVRDARFAVRLGADFVALSFVQTAQDVQRLKRLLRREAKGAEPPVIIAKIEKPSALDHLDEILTAADGVMVARGDLGVELSLEKVPMWQKRILLAARAHGMHSITATEMLQSMVQSSTPTRAEVSDAANAILDGTDALMLSAETAVGSYPEESVKMLARIARETDRPWLERSAAEIDTELPLVEPGEVDPVCALARSAVDLAARLEARWLVAFTLTGRTVRLLARHRPPVPILALTPSESTRRRLTLAWNTQSVLLPRIRSVDEMMRLGLELVQAKGLIRRGDRLVISAGIANIPEATNLLRVIQVGEG